MAEKKYYKVKRNVTYKGKLYLAGKRIYLSEEEKKGLEKYYII